MATAERRGIVHQAWPRVLLGGLVVLVALAWSLAMTENPNFVPGVLLAGSFLVPVTLVTYLYERRPADDIPVGTVALCFLWGGALGTQIAGVLEYGTLHELGVFALLGVGVIEECAKLVVPLAIFARGRYRTEADGLLFGVASGMGFAALETMGYGFVAFIASRGNLGALEATLVVRGLLSPAGHAAWTGLICAVLWRERRRAGHSVVNRAVVSAFLGAVLLHALWDTLNSIRGPAIGGWDVTLPLSLAVALTSLILLIRRVRESRRVEASSTVPHRARGGRPDGVEPAGVWSRQTS